MIISLLAWTGGSIKERWLSSTIAVRNGPLAPPDEGMSYVDTSGNIEDKVLFKDFVDAAWIGTYRPDVKRHVWHLADPSPSFTITTRLCSTIYIHAKNMLDGWAIGKSPKLITSPPQLNNHLGSFPYTFFGFDPDVSKEEVKARLTLFRKGDNRITELSRAFRLELGTGWYTPPGVIHAPGSLLTYEPQWNADVKSVFQNVHNGEIFPYELLVDCVPEESREDLDYILGLLDWEKNVDPHYRKTYFRRPVVASIDDAHVEKWVCYATGSIAAKELTVAPGAQVTVRDRAAYGCVLTQGHGKFGPYPAEAVSLLRFGALSSDEFFVSEQAASDGVTVVNHSQHEPLVLLKHFGPNAGDPSEGTTV